MFGLAPFLRAHEARHRPALEAARAAGAEVLLFFLASASLFFSFAYSSGDMPLGTYACSFVPDFAGADDWKAWAPPKAKASNTEVFMAAKLSKPSLYNRVCLFQRSTRSSDALAQSSHDPRR